MTTIYHIDTNAYEALVAVNTDEESAFCITDAGCSASEVEDWSSWEAIDYTSFMKELPTLTVLDSVVTE